MKCKVVKQKKMFFFFVVWKKLRYRRYTERKDDISLSNILNFFWLFFFINLKWTGKRIKMALKSAKRSLIEHKSTYKEQWERTEKGTVRREPSNTIEYLMKKKKEQVDRRGMKWKERKKKLSPSKHSVSRKQSLNWEMKTLKQQSPYTVRVSE